MPSVGHRTDSDADRNRELLTNPSAPPQVLCGGAGAASPPVPTTLRAVENAGHMPSSAQYDRIRRAVMAPHQRHMAALHGYIPARQVRIANADLGAGEASATAVGRTMGDTYTSPAHGRRAASPPSAHRGPLRKQHVRAVSRNGSRMPAVAPAAFFPSRMALDEPWPSERVGVEPRGRHRGCAS